MMFSLVSPYGNNGEQASDHQIGRHEKGKEGHRAILRWLSVDPAFLCATLRLLLPVMGRSEAEFLRTELGQACPNQHYSG